MMDLNVTPLYNFGGTKIILDGLKIILEGLKIILDGR